MLRKLIALSVVFALVLAEPAAKLTAPSYDDLLPTYLGVRNDQNDIQSKTLVPLDKPNAIALAFDLFNAVVGYKASAVTIATAAIKWLVSNVIVLVIGAIGTFGFCKLTGMCHLVEDLVPVAQLQSFVTPERLESAEGILAQAVKRYAQENEI